VRSEKKTVIFLEGFWSFLVSKKKPLAKNDKKSKKHHFFWPPGRHRGQEFGASRKTCTKFSCQIVFWSNSVVDVRTLMWQFKERNALLC
jgi:hypothetical protein